MILLKILGMTKNFRTALIKLSLYVVTISSLLFRENFLHETVSYKVNVLDEIIASIVPLR